MFHFTDIDLSSVICLVKNINKYFKKLLQHKYCIQNSETPLMSKIPESYVS